MEYPSTLSLYCQTLRSAMSRCYPMEWSEVENDTFIFLFELWINLSFDSIHLFELLLHYLTYLQTQPSSELLCSGLIRVHHSLLPLPPVITSSVARINAPWTLLRTDFEVKYQGETRLRVDDASAARASIIINIPSHPNRVCITGMNRVNTFTNPWPLARRKIRNSVKTRVIQVCPNFGLGVTEFECGMMIVRNGTYSIREQSGWRSGGQFSPTTENCVHDFLISAVEKRDVTSIRGSRREKFSIV